MSELFELVVGEEYEVRNSSGSEWRRREYAGTYCGRDLFRDNGGLVLLCTWRLVRPVPANDVSIKMLVRAGEQPARLDRANVTADQLARIEGILAED